MKDLPNDLPIDLPGGFAPAFALGYADPAGRFALIDHDSPLPVLARAESPPQPLEGMAATIGEEGPFTPVTGTPVMLRLAGEWEGTVTVTRSTDNGATRNPLTLAGAPWASFTGNACEPVWVEYEDGATLYLEFDITDGTVDWRIAQ